MALVFCCVLIHHIFYAYLNYIYTSVKLETFISDLALCTPDDYAIEIDITPEFYKKVSEDNEKNLKESDTPTIQFFEF